MKWVCGRTKLHPKVHYIHLCVFTVLRDIKSKKEREREKKRRRRENENITNLYYFQFCLTTNREI